MRRVPLSSGYYGSVSSIPRNTARREGRHRKKQITYVRKIRGKHSNVNFRRSPTALIASFVILLSLLTVVISLSIVGSPAGGESRANETITGNQGSPAVCVASDGSFVVAWSSELQDGDSGGVYFQMFDEVPIPEF